MLTSELFHTHTADVMPVNAEAIMMCTEAATIALSRALSDPMILEKVRYSTTGEVSTIQVKRKTQMRLRWRKTAALSPETTCCKRPVEVALKKDFF